LENSNPTNLSCPLVFAKKDVGTKSGNFLNGICRVKGPNYIYWALSLGRERKKSKEERMVMNGSDSRLNEQDMKGKVVRGGISPWIG